MTAKKEESNKPRVLKGRPQIYKNPVGNVTQKKRSIFEHRGQNAKEISAEIIRADCMNHGYRLDRTIGEGAYAKVKLGHVLAGKLARNRNMSDIVEESGELKVAIKIIETRVVPREFIRKFLPREIHNHAHLTPSPHVVQIYEHFSTQEHVYVVMEYCENGDLLELINSRIGQNQRGVGEEVARKLFQQICTGVQHIHSSGYVHRDLKCENILLDGNMNCKVTDFGFSCQFDDKSILLKTSCGSYAYTAPEVIKCKSYNGHHADIWSLGVILFAMVNGRLPFNDNQLSEMEEDMKMQRLKFERAVPFDCMMLIRKILQFVPSHRLSLNDIMNDAWITGKKPIPRQRNKPEWSDNYSVKKSQNNECEVGTMAVDCSGRKESSPVASKPISENTIPPNRSMVLLNQENGDKVTLKSRKGANKKNIRAISPGARRPNTWPKVTKNMLPRKYDCHGSTAKTSDSSNLTELSYMLARMQADDPQAKIDLWKDKATGGKHIPNWFIQKLLQQSDQTSAACDLPMEGDVSHTHAQTVKIPLKERKSVKMDSENIRQAYRSYIEKLRMKHAEESKRSPHNETVQYPQSYKPSKIKSAKTGSSPSRTVSKVSHATQSPSSKSHPDQYGIVQENGWVSPGRSRSTNTSRSSDYARKSPAERSRDNREKLLKLYGKHVNCYITQQTLPPLLGQSFKPAADEDSLHISEHAKSPTSGRLLTKSARHRSCRTYQIKPVHKIIMHSCC